MRINYTAIFKIIENIPQIQTLFADKKVAVKVKKDLNLALVLLDELKVSFYDSKKASKNFIMTKPEAQRVLLIKGFNEGLNSSIPLFEEWFALVQELIFNFKIIIDLAEKTQDTVSVRDNKIWFEKNTDFILYNSTNAKIEEIINAIEKIDTFI